MASKTSAISIIKINFVTNADTGSIHIVESSNDGFCIRADEGVERLLTSLSDRGASSALPARCCRHAVVFEDT
jgi:hypothetical protein